MRNSTLFLSLFVLSLSLSAQPGELINAFGNGGYASNPTLTGPHEFKFMSVQSDGKLVCSGYIDNGSLDFLVARFNDDGSPDTGFGTNGAVQLNVENIDASWHMAIQPDGKILAVGFSTNLAGTDNDMCVIRLNTDGTLDNSFGTNGVVTVDFNGGWDRAWTVAIQPDGKILIGGSSVSGGSADMAMARLNVNGTLDNTFGAGGLLYIDLAVDESIEDIIVQNDGRILVLGTTLNGTAEGYLARLNTNGTFDSSFGTAGAVTYVHTSGYDMAFTEVVLTQTQDIIVVGATSSFASSYDGVVLKYNSAGQLDASFGNNGAALLDNGLNDDILYAGFITSNGQIVVSGYNELGSGDRGWAVWRLNADGSKDLNFSQNGIQVMSATSGNEALLGCAEAMNGDILAAGFLNPGNTGNFEALLIRLDGSNSIGIDETSTSMLTIWPNPAKDLLNISAEGFAMHYFQITDMTGKICLDHQSSQTIIDISGLEPGPYHLRYANGNMVQSRLFMVE